MQKAFRHEATKGSPVLFLAGGYEFVQYEPARTPSRQRLAFMADAFDALRHDVLVVTPSERTVLARSGVKPRPYWRGSSRLEKHVLKAGAVKVGLLVLPELPNGARGVPQNLIHGIENAVRDLRDATQIVVAMSPWGYAREQELLKADGPLPHVLLGSGPGVGVAGMLANGGKTAWMRSYPEGKSVLCLETLELPHGDSTFKWTEGRNIRMTLYGLTDQYLEDQQMLMLMHTKGTD